MLRAFPCLQVQARGAPTRNRAARCRAARPRRTPFPPTRLGAYHLSLALTTNHVTKAATDPSELKKVDHPTGRDDDAVIERLFESLRGCSESVICGWGPQGALHSRSEGRAAARKVLSEAWRDMEDPTVW